MSRHSVATLAVLALLAACDKESTIVQPDNSSVAMVTIINATTSVVKPYVGATYVGTANLQALNWQQACARVTPGSNTVVFKDLADADIATSAATSFEAGKRYTAILSANGAARSVLVLPETFTNLTPGNYGVRIINVTGQSGDFFVTTPTATVSGTPTVSLATDAATGAADGTGAYMTFPITQTRVRMFNTGTVTPAQGSVTLDSPQLTTGVPWTMGVTALFALNSSNVITPFTAGQCQ
jgi:hypothetical protein